MNIIDLYEKYDNLYYIGGVVRDILIKMPSQDVDITVEGNAIEFCKNIDECEMVQSNPDFGTVRVKINNQIYDISSTRKEIYPKKGHLPRVVEIGCPLKDDVIRRDFTINALAKNTKTGEIIDYVGGREDISNKILRVLHDNSFIDDPTRIIRGLKFAVRFGFSLDEHTKSLQNAYLSNINYDMCYKRLKDELISTFNLNSNRAFETFVNDKMYKLITKKDFELPDYDIQGLVRKYYKNLSNVWLIYIALIDTEKLELNKTETKIVDDYKKLVELDIKNDYEIVRAFEKCEVESILLYEITKKDGKAIKYLDELNEIKPEIDGNDLKKMGLPPSEKYAIIFDYILQEKLKNPELTKPEELELAEQYEKKLSKNNNDSKGDS